MPDDSTEKPWSGELKTLIGGNSFSGLHPEGQLKAIDGVMKKYPVWDSQSAEQRHSFAQKALTKYGSAGPSASQATSYNKQDKATQLDMFGRETLAQAKKDEPLVMRVAAGTASAGPGSIAEGVYGTKDVLAPVIEPIAEKVNQYAGRARDWWTTKGDLKQGAVETEKATVKAKDVLERKAADETKSATKAISRIGTDTEKKKFIDAARNRLVNKITGVSVKDTLERRGKALEENADGVYVAGPEHMDDVQRTKAAAREPINMEQGWYGSQYELATKDHLTEQPDPKLVQSYLKGEGGAEEFDLGPATALRNEANSMFFPKPKEAVGGMSADEINSLFEQKVDVPNKAPGAYNIPAIKNLETGEVHANPQGHGMAYDDFVKNLQGNPKFEEGFVRDGKYLTKEEALKTTDKISTPNAAAKPELPKEGVPTVADIKRLRSKASNMAYNVEPHTPPHHFALGLVKSLDDQLAAHGIKGLKELGPAYSDFRHATDPILHGIMKEGQDQVLNSAAIFSPKNPQGGLHVVSNASPEQLTQLRQTFGDLYNAIGPAVLDPQLAPMFQKMWPGTPLADPNHWVQLDKGVEHFPQVLHDDPVALQQYQQMFTEQSEPILDKAAQNFVDKAVDVIGKLPGGEAKAAAISKAGDVRAQAATAYRMISGMDPKQAAIEAIQTGVVKADPNKLGMGASFDSVKNRSVFYLAANMLGASSPFMHVMGVGAGVVTGRSMLGAVIRQGLKNPEAAEALYKSILNPSDPKAMEWITQQAARGTMAGLVNRLQKNITPEPANPKPKPVPKTKAENVSLNATGNPKLASLSSAPLAAVMTAYNKAKDEDMDAKTASTLRSMAIAKAKDVGVAQLDPKSRLQLAEMLKDAPHLDDSETERADSRGLGA